MKIKIPRYEHNINPVSGRYEVPFTHLGKYFKLVKRVQGREGSWYLRMEHRAKAYWRSADTADADLALIRVKALIDAIFRQDQQLLEKTKLHASLQYSKLEEEWPVFQ